VWHVERGARAYNRGLAEPQPGPGAEPLLRGSRGEAPEAWALLGPGRPKLSFVLWVIISLITAWCRQLNWRRQSFQFEGNCMFNCRSAFSWFSSILNGDNDNLKFVKKIIYVQWGLNPSKGTPSAYATAFVLSLASSFRASLMTGRYNCQLTATAWWRRLDGTGEDKGAWGLSQSPPNATDNPQTWLIQPLKHDSSKFVLPRNVAKSRSQYCSVSF